MFVKFPGCFLNHKNVKKNLKLEQALVAIEVLAVLNLLMFVHPF